MSGFPSSACRDFFDFFFVWSELRSATLLDLISAVIGKVRSKRCVWQKRRRTKVGLKALRSNFRQAPDHAIFTRESCEGGDAGATA